jgi:hypothetical protein
MEINISFSEDGIFITTINLKERNINNGVVDN